MLIMMCQYSNKILKQFNTAKVLLLKFDKYHKFAVTVHVYVIYTSNGSVNMNNQLGFKLLKQLWFKPHEKKYIPLSNILPEPCRGVIRQTVCNKRDDLLENQVSTGCHGNDLPAVMPLPAWPISGSSSLAPTKWYINLPTLLKDLHSTAKGNDFWIRSSNNCGWSPPPPPKKKRQGFSINN